MLEEYDNSSFIMEERSMANKDSNKDLIIGQIGFLVMSMLFMSTMATSLIVKDKVSKVYYRIIAGPIKISVYMVYSILSFFVIACIQVVLVFSFIRYMLGYDFSGNFGYVVLLGIIFALVCVAFGVAISSLSKDEKQAGVVMSLVISPMCMLGGCWWPREVMPEFLNKIANFVPTTWIMSAFGDLLSGKGIESTYDSILVLFGFLILFSLLAIWRRSDIAK